MEYSVTYHKYNDDYVDEKYNGYVEINIYFQHSKINWIISDCGCYPSTSWEILLNFMKNINDDKSPSIGGGSNSTWYADVHKSKFRLYFDISGCGGDSTMIHEFDIDMMIPVVDQIIENIKLME
jgi:hypothetical protein